LGRIYGVQWRKWRKPLIRVNKVILQNHDQLIELVNGLKHDPYSRRHIITAWNPGELELMALPPCHMVAQFYVSNGRLSCQMYQRSADMFLGVPFNIASYALFTHMLAQVCNLEADELIITFGDAHIYNNHIDQVKEQLSRTPLPLPQLKLNPNIDVITDFGMEDVELLNYESHAAIRAEMAV
jgi:thymidylate synthase